MLLLFHNKKYTIPLSYRLSQKYELIKQINQVVETKREQSLSIITSKKEVNLIRYLRISLSYDNKDAKYKIIIKNTNSDLVLIFSINNLNEMLFSLMDGMIFPGSKFIGLEAVELLDNRKDHRHWKAKCLICGKIVEISNEDIKRRKSCGCLNGSSFNSDEERFYSKVDKQENIPKELQIRGTLGLDEEPCWLWVGYKDKDGYGEFLAGRKRDRAHRYQYKQYYNKDLQSDIFVCHRCDNPSCVNPNHLFEGTQLDNMRDKIKKGRGNEGERSPNHKLTEKEVLEIRSIKKKHIQDITKNIK